MAKSDVQTGFWSGVFHVELYKRTQGRLTRQLTALGLGLIVLYGVWTLSQGPLSTYSRTVRSVVPTAIMAVAAWLIFRLVNYPRFADFLISVQAEMDKVSWPSKQEIVRATWVVLTIMVFLSLILFGFDLFWVWLFTLLRILRPDTPTPE